MRIGIDSTTIADSKPAGFGVHSINIVNESSELLEDIVVWTINCSSLRINN